MIRTNQNTQKIYFAKFFGLRLIIVIFALVHLSLFAYGISHPDSFMVGDRTKQRFRSIDLTINSSNTIAGLIDAIIERGWPGDYLLQGTIYGLASSTGVVVIQLLSYFVAIVYLYLLVKLIFDSKKIAILASITYIFLPGSLIQPHTLVSEGFYNPFIIISFYYSVLYLKHNRLKDLLLAALLISCAASIRFVLILYPFLFGFIVLFLADPLKRITKEKVKHIICYISIAMLIPLLWMGIYYSHTGVLGMGIKGSGLTYNMFLRIERMSNIGNIEIEQEYIDSKTMSPRIFFNYILNHPTSFIKTIISDINNLALNTGINTFAGRYLGLFEMSENRQYWRDMRDSNGLFFTIIELFKWDPVMIITNALATTFWLFYMLFAFLGAYILVRLRDVPLAIKVTVLTFPVYVVGTQFAASTPRWSHRTPTEFVFSLLFALGLAFLIQYKRRVASFWEMGSNDA